MAAPTGSGIVSDNLLQRCRERAPGYDRDNRFFQEDFDDLRRAGYLTIAVPRELGGQGLTFAECMREQRRLAYYAHATALAMNMHLYWVGVAADLWRAGDRSLEWLLRGAANGEVFAAGHAERGNDIPVLLSTTKAERVAGGYRFTGHKSFGSLTPVWTYLGLHGMDTSDPAAPKVVHAFMPRATEGYSIKETWDVLGMRATASQDTLLQGAFVPDRYIARVVAPGFAGADLFILAIFGWALTGFANVYYGMAEARARSDGREPQDQDLDRPGQWRADAPPGDPAQRGRDGDRAGGDRSSARPDRRRLDQRCGPRGRLADEFRGHQVPDHGGGVEGGGHRARPRGWLWHLRGVRDGAVLPRRAAAAGSTRPTPPCPTSSSPS